MLCDNEQLACIEVENKDRDMVVDSVNLNKDRFMVVDSVN